MKDPNKRKHWSLKWAMKNLSQVASIMVLSSHVKEDIDCLDRQSCLLGTIFQFKMVSELENNDLQGSYLYHDLNDSKWIRSGKATGRGLLSRHEQHMRAASSPRVTSNFYYMYPSKTKDSGLKSSRRRGYFEHLRQYVALAFDPKNEAVRTTMVERYNNSQGGLFSFSDDGIKKINNVKKNSRHTFVEKRIDMISYLFELGYDLCLSPLDCVSQNPGFESVLGIW